MRDFKKHFFETLIQLTILANVFRHNNHPFSTTSPEGDHQHYPLFNLNLSQQSFQSQYTEPDLLFLQDNFNFSATIDNLNQENYRVKEVRSYFNELNLINRQNQQLSRALPIPRQETLLPNIVLQPASAIYPSNNHKRIIDLSETRILLNSLELNANNNNSLRKVSSHFIYSNSNSNTFLMNCLHASINIKPVLYNHLLFKKRNLRWI